MGERVHGVCRVYRVESSELKETEIGLIPKDWEVVRLGEVVENLKQGKILPTNKIKSYGKFPVYGANGLIGFYDEGFVPKNKVLIIKLGLFQRLNLAGRGQSN